MMATSCNILFFTDCHLNHPKLDPQAMTQRLLNLITDAVLKNQVDVMLMGGDWFDRPTSFTSKAGVYILDAMSSIIDICHRHKIKLRILKGTGCHDGIQNNNWVPLAARRDGLDFKLYDEVDVFSDLGFTILTIPDSTIPNHHKCEVAVRTKMVELGIDKVDLAFTHGMFTHHLKDAGYEVEAHDSEYYNSLLDIVCLNGHIHLPGLWNRILTGGSTDRLRQGENHAKGIHLVKIDRKTKKFEAVFFENRLAATFNSYDVTSMDPNEAIDKLIPVLDTLPKTDVFIRLHYVLDVPIRTIDKALSEKYPHISFDSVPNSKAIEALRSNTEVVLARDVPEGISPDTLIPLVGGKFARMDIEFTPAHMAVLEGIRDDNL